MMKMFDSKQELREDIERRTSPDRPILEQTDAIFSSRIAAGCIGVRNGLHLLRSLTVDNNEFPCEEHEEITHRVMAGMRERFIAFELELLSVIVDLAWEVNNCECDHCAKVTAEADVADKESKAKYN